MAKYMVTWHADVEADSPEEAAHKARLLVLDPGLSPMLTLAVTEAAYGALTRIVELPREMQCRVFPR